MNSSNITAINIELSEKIDEVFNDRKTQSYDMVAESTMSTVVMIVKRLGPPLAKALVVMDAIGVASKTIKATHESYNALRDAIKKARESIGRKKQIKA